MPNDKQQQAQDKPRPVTDDSERELSLPEADLEEMASEVETGAEGEPARKELPTELFVLPQPGNVVFPGMLLPAHVRQERHLKIVEQIVTGNKLFLALTLKDKAADESDPDSFYRVGTACAILQMLKLPDGSVRFLAHGLQRSRVESIERTDSLLRARVTYLLDVVAEDVETVALTKNLRAQFLTLMDALPNVGDEMKVLVGNVDEPGRLADLVASNLSISAEERQKVLEAVDVRQRLKITTKLLAREMEYAEVAQKIQSEARSEIDKGQREYYLRQQLKAIQAELGEADAQAAEVNELKKQLAAKGLPEEARKAAEHELGRLQAINPASPEYAVVRTYLGWILDLPWKESTPDNLDLDVARRVLEEDHYGLEKVKERVLEFLAVRKLREDMRGSILCFVGPPGTGKTSIGKSIARAMGRKYLRVSLGGVRDEAEIRGHRRTYIGALPGQIILSLKKAGSNNPVFMLDEVDKLGADFRGDPASALLEVLDPEQNVNYTDHYLDLPFDLSRVMFICTANILDTVPPALRDRMEVLEFPGYTAEEKLQIARHYLVPDQIEGHGLKPEHLTITDGALRRIISEYTREAGVRNLERHIASICRKAAKAVAMGERQSQRVDEDGIPEMLGPPLYLREVIERVNEPGVATGLAWTPTGGTVIFVEATRTPGDGRLILTGQLGEVMKESAQAALTYTRAHAQELGVDPKLYGKHDFHIHVPAGAIPKDGPSAGITMGAALISLCTGRIVRHNVAMTGEITLRGKVLSVGGIKEKVLAAEQAGIDTIVLPKQNEKDLADIPPYAREKLKFVLVDSMAGVVAAALRDGAERKGDSAGEA